MTIKSVNGSIVTPKTKAQELLMLQLNSVMYRLYELEDDLTDAERAKVEAHVIKQFRRVEKLLGYEVGSWSFA